MNPCSKKSHLLIHPSMEPLQAAAGPNWPNFRGTAQKVGTIGKTTVYVDPAVGSAGLMNAQDLLADSARVVAANDAIFGTNSGLTNVIVWALNGPTDGTGGADHWACDYTSGQDIEVDASFGNSARVSALFEAELSECSMGGRLCGVSTGEALSRRCANEIVPGALADFATAPKWFNSGMPDWVNRTNPTDQDNVSTGCGMAFISWLRSLGYPLSKIAPAMVALGDQGTLAHLYVSLTSDSPSNAWPKFLAAVKALPNGVTSDDPFAGSTPPPTCPAGQHWDPVQKKCVPDAPPPVKTLFSIPVKRSVPKGSLVWFRAPVAIPAGTYDWDVFEPGKAVGAYVNLESPE